MTQFRNIQKAGGFIDPLLRSDNPDLLGKWTMDNISGATLVDESTNGIDGTINGAITSTGWLGDALDFGTANNNVDFGQTLLTDADQEYGFSFAMKVDNIASDGVILSRYNHAGTFAGIVILYTAAGRLQVLTRKSSGDYVFVESPDGGVVQGAWQHFVCNIGMLGDIQISIDDVDQAVITTPTGTVDAITFQSVSTQLGGGRRSPTTSWVDGHLDQVYLFNRKLTAPEITTLYFEGGIS